MADNDKDTPETPPITAVPPKLADVGTIRVRANAGVLGLAAGEIGPVPVGDETDALLDNGMIERVEHDG